jgi:glutamate synthase domain-containing protein 1
LRLSTVAKELFISQLQGKALSHRRYSTNASPSWQAVQSFRLAAYKCEINTLLGRRNWMRARAILDRWASGVLDFRKVLPRSHAGPRVPAETKQSSATAEKA